MVSLTSDIIFHNGKLDLRWCDHLLNLINLNFSPVREDEKSYDIEEWGVKSACSNSNKKEAGNHDSGFHNPWCIQEEHKACL